MTPALERHVGHVINLIDATRDRAEAARLRRIADDMIKEAYERERNALYTAMLNNLCLTMGEK